MGTSHGQILRVFLLQGGLLGFVGSLFGAALGAFVLIYWHTFARQTDGTELFPMVVERRLFVMTALLATMTGLLAAMAPAVRAAKLDPVEAIRGVRKSCDLRRCASRTMWHAGPGRGASRYESSPPAWRVCRTDRAIRLGKSTLLNIVGLLDAPNHRPPVDQGADTERARRRGYHPLRGHTIGFVFQYHLLISAFTARENVMMPLLVDQGNSPPPEIEQRGDTSAGAGRSGTLATILPTTCPAVSNSAWRSRGRCR